MIIDHFKDITSYIRMDVKPSLAFGGSMSFWCYCIVVGVHFFFFNYLFNTAPGMSKVPFFLFFRAFFFGFLNLI